MAYLRRIFRLIRWRDQLEEGTWPERSQLLQPIQLMQIRFEFIDSVCILRLEGRFATGGDWDYLSCKTGELIATGYRNVIADFSAVPCIDSAGLGFVAHLYRSFTRERAGQFALLNPNPRVREVLHMTQLTSVLPIFDAEQSALTAMKRANGSGA